MKHIRISLIVALILGAMVALSSVRAADAPATEAPAKKQRMTTEQRVTQMAEQLKLDEKQTAKLKTAMEEQNKAMAAVRSDTTMDAAAKTAKNKEIRDKYNTTVKAFLTDEQKTKFESMQQQGGKKGKKKA
jgi:periplasmic protein CpxP/Spy